MKLRREPEPIIVVGGGSILVPDVLAGASTVVRPEHFEVANAVGAAIAQVSGEVDQIVSLEGGREAILARAQELAVQRARSNGAQPQSVQIVELEDVPVPYMEDEMIRVRVKAVGDLASSLVSVPR
jgi:N-methylhydantoinase A/oxoprolinase/acetone carboxylase beta subunit